MSQPKPRWSSPLPNQMGDPLILAQIKMELMASYLDEENRKDDARSAKKRKSVEKKKTMLSAEDSEGHLNVVTGSKTIVDTVFPSVRKPVIVSLHLILMFLGLMLVLDISE